MPAFLIDECRDHCENLRPYTWLCHLAFFIVSKICTSSRSAGEHFTFFTFLEFLVFFWGGESYLNWPGLAKINSFLMNKESIDKGPLSYTRNL